MKILKKELTYTLVKNNLSIIILLPTIMGGFWQILELASIGIPFIRFFSVSQLIADGLLIIFIMGVVVTMLLLAVLIRSKNIELSSNSDVNKGTENLSKRSRNALSIVLLAISITLFILLVTLEVKPILIAGRTSLSKLLLILIFLSLSIALFITEMTSLIKNNNWRSNKWMKMLIDQSKIITGVVILWVLANFFQIFHNSFLLPENLKNIDKISTRIKESHSDLKSHQLLYLNDKYIFIQLTDSLGKKYTEIFKLDALLGDN